MDDAERRARLLVARLNLVAAALSVLYLGWAMTPQHTRRLWAMRATARMRSLLSRYARRAGAAELRRELAGRHPGYEVPYALSCARDRLGAFYEKLRQVTP